MPVTNAPTRLQLLECAKKLILDQGAAFSVTSITKELNCSRSHIRRFFPTKANLITAAFREGDSNPLEAEAGGRADIIISEPSVKEDLVIRRFRVFERAIASLESEIKTVRSENASSLLALERKLRTKVDCKEFSEPRLRPTLGGDQADPNIHTSQNVGTAKHSCLEAEAALRLDLLSKAQIIRDPGNQTSQSVGEEYNIGLEPQKDSALQGPLEAKDPVFIAALDDEPSGKEGWKHLLPFGLTAFAAALLIALIFLAFTNGAGASYLLRGPSKQIADQKPRTGQQRKSLDFTDRAPHQSVINATGSPLIPESTTARSTSSSFDKFNVGSVSVLDASKVEAVAKVKIALAYLKGDGVRSDPLMGAVWSEIAARQGNADAQYILGTLYSEGIKADPEKAYNWFSSAAVSGHPKAMHNLAIALFNGNGVPEDKASAVNWFVRAANLGYRDSAFDLGVLFERGEGVRQDTNTALSWYDVAASSGETSGPSRPRSRLMRDSTREVRWYCASSMLGAASAHTHRPECGLGWRSLGR